MPSKQFRKQEKESALERLRYYIPTIETSIYSLWHKNSPSGYHAYSILVARNDEVINITHYVIRAFGYRATKNIALYAYSAQDVADRIEKELFPNPPKGDFGTKYLRIRGL